MKKIILSISFTLLFHCLFSQIDTEFYAKYKRESCQTIDTHVRASLKGTCFLDYIVKKIKDSTQLIYLEDRRDLYGVKKNIMYDDYVDFSDSLEGLSIRVKLSKSSAPLKSLKNVDCERFNGDWYVNSIDGRYAYGISIKPKIIKRISEIEIVINGKQIIIPDSVFSNLFFPSFNVEFKNIKPLELYYSKKAECFYLYVFGFDRFPYSVDMDVRKVNTYFSKIVFDQNRFICQITTSWGELFWYNMDCGYFIGY